VQQIHGFLCGTVVIMKAADLTAPTFDDAFDASKGRLHR
jgi:hypothetical protein